MTTSLIQRLKPYVSAFSEEIAAKHKHGERLIVGGTVTGILNLSQLLESSFDEELRKEGVYVTLDDGVGECTVVLVPLALDAYEATYGPLQKGDIILAEGRVFRLDTTHTYKGAKGKTVTVDKHDKETVRVLSYQLAPLPEEQPSPSSSISD